MARQNHSAATTSLAVLGAFLIAVGAIGMGLSGCNTNGPLATLSDVETGTIEGFIELLNYADQPVTGTVNFSSGSINFQAPIRQGYDAGVPPFIRDPLSLVGPFRYAYYTATLPAGLYTVTMDPVVRLLSSAPARASTWPINSSGGPTVPLSVLPGFLNKVPVMSIDIPAQP